MVDSDGRSDGMEWSANPRDSLVLALDMHDLDAASRIARLLHGYFGVAKVGLELYSAAGPAAVDVLVGMGYEVFCDLKLHDIPTTVGRAAEVIGRIGASYLTVHAAGGRTMLKSAVEGLAAGALSGSPRGGSVDGERWRGSRVPGDARVLAVTVLTSERDAPEGLLAQRMRLAADVGCHGIVCASSDLAVADRLDAAEGHRGADRFGSPRRGGLIRVVPGIRMPGDSTDDQSRVSTPAAALKAGADLLVVGRPVVRSPDPVAAAERLHGHLRFSDGCGQPVE